MAAVVNGLVHQTVGHLLDRSHGERLGQSVVVEFVEQPVAAQQVPVAQHRLEFPAVDYRVGLDAQRPGENVALRVAGSLLGGDLPGPHQVRHQAVVIAHLCEFPNGVAVHTAVSDVGDGQHLVTRCRVDDGQRTQGRAHA